MLIPLGGARSCKTAALGWDAVRGRRSTSPRALAAYRLSASARRSPRRCVNAVFGLVVAWVLVRYRFPGRALVDALVDLPFALPTAVAGIALTALYAQNGWLGPLPRAARHQGRVHAARRRRSRSTFIGLPFVVRTRAAGARGPRRARSRRRRRASARAAGRRSARVILPALCAGARSPASRSRSRAALGEYGSVVFIAGNMPMKTEIAPLLIVTKLEQYDYAGATAIAVGDARRVVRAAARDQRAPGAGRAPRRRR